MLQAIFVVLHRAGVKAGAHGRELVDKLHLVGDSDCVYSVQLTS